MRASSSITFLVVALLCVSAASSAESETYGSATSWYVQVGTYEHYRNKEKYKGKRLFGSIEYNREDKLILGFSVFNNSFDNVSQYAYVGKNYYPWEKWPAVRVKITMGIARGYEGENHKVLPIRWGDSWGIGFVPAIGYQRHRVGFDLAVLGESGLLFLVGYEF